MKQNTLISRALCGISVSLGVAFLSASLACAAEPTKESDDKSGNMDQSMPGMGQKMSKENGMMGSGASGGKHMMDSKGGRMHNQHKKESMHKDGSQQPTDTSTKTPDKEMKKDSGTNGM
jgi:hypothetical protein